jgi:hypothetical protein
MFLHILAYSVDSNNKDLHLLTRKLQNNTWVAKLANYLPPNVHALTQGRNWGRLLVRPPAGTVQGAAK